MAEFKIGDRVESWEEGAGEVVYGPYYFRYPGASTMYLIKGDDGVYRQLDELSLSPAPPVFPYETGVVYIDKDGDRWEFREHDGEMQYRCLGSHWFPCEDLSEFVRHLDQYAPFRKATRDNIRVGDRVKLYVSDAVYDAVYEVTYGPYPGEIGGPYALIRKVGTPAEFPVPIAQCDFAGGEQE